MYENTYMSDLMYRLLLKGIFSSNNWSEQILTPIAHSYLSSFQSVSDIKICYFAGIYGDPHLKVRLILYQLKQTLSLFLTMGCWQKSSVWFSFVFVRLLLRPWLLAHWGSELSLMVLWKHLHTLHSDTQLLCKNVCACIMLQQTP